MSAQAGCLAVLNAGSSSIKFALYEVASDHALLFRNDYKEANKRVDIVPAVLKCIMDRLYGGFRLCPLVNLSDDGPNFSLIGRWLIGSRIGARD